jgi:hypothetical protein
LKPIWSKSPVLTITEAQMRAMADARIAEFVAAAVRRIRRSFVDELSAAGYRDEDLKQAVAHWIAEARGCGLCTRAQMSLYVDAHVLLGSSPLANDTQAPELAVRLRDMELSAEAKAETLRDHLIFGQRTAGST